MTLREIWFTLIGQPERAASTTEDSVAKIRNDARLEVLDWSTTDSPGELVKRAERAGEASTASVA
jgi:hypothetical protein